MPIDQFRLLFSPHSDASDCINDRRTVTIWPDRHFISSEETTRTVWPCWCYPEPSQSDKSRAIVSDFWHLIGFHPFVWEYWSWLNQVRLFFLLWHHSLVLHQGHESTISMGSFIWGNDLRKTKKYQAGSLMQPCRYITIYAIRVIQAPKSKRKESLPGTYLCSKDIFREGDKYHSTPFPLEAQLEERRRHRYRNQQQCF